MRSLFTRFWVLGKGTLCYPSPGIASCKNIYHCYFFLFLFFICCKFLSFDVQKFFSLVVDTWYCTFHSFIYLGEQKWKTSLASQPIWSASYIETLSINLFSLSDPIVINYHHNTICKCYHYTIMSVVPTLMEFEFLISFIRSSHYKGNRTLTRRKAKPKWSTKYCYVHL